MQQTELRVKGSFDKLNHWIDKHGYKGYDPHDIKGLSLFIYFLKPKHSILIKIIRKPFFYAIDYFPLTLRKLFRVPKTINAKGMALFAKAYLNMFEITSDIKYRKKAELCLEWLSDNKSKGFKNNAWGYPFDWQSGVFTPAGTPASVVCNAVGDAFWKAWKLFGDQKYLDICTGLCKFYLEDLNVDVMNNNALCFSYTPLDRLHVHNANLLIAEFLIRIGKATNDQLFIEKGERAAQYALDEQNEDGSIYYWGNDQQYHSPHAIDHYHSGFEIRCLYAIWKLTGKAEYKNAYSRYFDFYKKHLVLREAEHAFPKMTPKNIYPINIHSCAEAIILNASLLNDHPEVNEYLDLMTDAIISEMQSDKGFFYYKKYKLGAVVRTDKTPYIRWGQGWMCLALSEYLFHGKKAKESQASISSVTA
jgi:hypothetical protein